MTVDAAPSGKAPPGRLGFGASTMALATAYPVAACGSHPHNNAGAEVAEGDTARVETWATKARSEASRRRMPYGYHTTQTPEERLT